MYYKILALSFSVLLASALFGTTAFAVDPTGYCRAGKDVIVDLPWPGGYGQIRPMTDGFKRSTVSYRIRVPDSVPDAVIQKSISDTNKGFIKIAEKPGSQATDHMFSLSQTPCDFNHSPITMGAGNTGPGIYFGVSKTLTGTLVLRPGQTYYLNVSHDLTGYGPMTENIAGTTVTNRQSCSPEFGGCDVLVDFMIPGGGAGYPYRTPSGPSELDPTQPLFPLLACHIIYGVNNLGSAQMSTSNMDLWQNANGSVTTASCPGPQAVQAVINQQALQSTGNSAATPSSGQGTGMTQSNLETLTATNSAEATAILQQLAKNAANNGVVVKVTSGGVSSTINGVTFTAPTVVELAANYYQYLQGGAGGVSAGGTNAGTTDAGSGLATALSTNLAPGDYNPADQVRLLQAFLNSEVAASLTLNGFFNDQTLVGVIKLQNKYASLTYQKAGLTSATGFVGQYTRDLINSKLGVASAGSNTGSASASAGPVVTNYCTGNDRIVPLDASTGANWPAQGQIRPRTGSGEYGSYNAVVTEGLKDQTVAFKVVVPFVSNPTNTTNPFGPRYNNTRLGSANVVEVPGDAVTGHDMTVSRNPCDFQSGTYIVNGIGQGNTGPGVYFTVNNPTGYKNTGAQFNLQPGDTVYFNVRNWNGATKTCPNAACNILFDFASPERY